MLNLLLIFMLIMTVIWTPQTFSKGELITELFVVILAGSNADWSNFENYSNWPISVLGWRRKKTSWHSRPIVCCFYFNFKKAKLFSRNIYKKGPECRSVYSISCTVIWLFSNNFFMMAHFPGWWTTWANCLKVVNGASMVYLLDMANTCDSR